MTTWPSLPLDSWRDTRDTLHMWTQIAGKICLALTPLVNHYWNITFRVTARGLMTPTLPYRDHTFTMTFDFLAHELAIEMSDGTREALPLRPQSVAEFYRNLMAALKRMGIEVHIWTMPVEVRDPIRFELDETHKSYDASAVRTFHDLLLAITPVFESFRSEFIGKCSPVHFFWGSFDLAVTRFNGKRAPERLGPVDSVTREAYSHEVISHGWWPGGGMLDAVNEPAFYAYAAPEPAGYKTAAVEPAGAFYSPELSIFILPYEAARTAASPEEELRSFLRTTYDAGARLGDWDRASLERQAVVSAQAGAETSR
jgi:Family of unknown function (DUF5996)